MIYYNSIWLSISIIHIYIYKSILLDIVLNLLSVSKDDYTQMTNSSLIIYNHDSYPYPYPLSIYDYPNLLLTSLSLQGFGHRATQLRAARGAPGHEPGLGLRGDAVPWPGWGWGVGGWWRGQGVVMVKWWLGDGLVVVKRWLGGWSGGWSGGWMIDDGSLMW